MSRRRIIFSSVRFFSAKHIVVLFLVFAWSNELFAQQTRPNILLIMTDDMAWNTCSIMDSTYPLQTPNIDRIGNEGAKINYYSTNSLCIPGRTSLLTGRYGHNTGVMNNSSFLPNNKIILPKLLNDTGYYVALLGKWMVNFANPSSHFDYWFLTPQSTSYFNETVQYWDSVFQTTGHVTDVLTDSAIDLISRIDTPFFIMLDHNAPHAPWHGQQQFDGTFNSTMFPHPENYPRYTHDYPSYLYADSGKVLHSEYQFQACMRNYTEMIAGIDESVGKVYDALDSAGLLSNTMILFTTDNGFMLGNHKIVDKYKPYDDCMKMPLLIRYPQWFTAGTVMDSSFALNIDITPTIFDAVGISDSGNNIEGVSIHDLVDGQKHRSEFLYEQAPPDSANPILRSFRDFNFQYTKYFCSIDTATEELFDMQNDPHQLVNLARDTSYQAILYQYRIKLDSIRTATNDTATIDLFPCYLKNDSIQFLSDTVIHSVCPGTSDFYQGHNYSQPGIYVDSFIVNLGYDSLACYELLNFPVYDDTSYENICEGNSFNFCGQFITTAGFYSHPYSSIHGCDSVKNLFLNVLPSFHDSSFQSICTGSQFDFYGTQLSASGNYYHYFTAVNGCDSVISLNLTVYNSYSDTIEDGLCGGSIYNFFGQPISVSGIYSHMLQSIHGCDSLITLELDSVTSYSDFLSESICPGASFNFLGQQLFAPGNYSHILISTGGCDSVINLSLSISNTYSDTISTAICSGSAYNFYGQQIFIQGNYSHTLTTVNGCDSVINLQLSVELFSGTVSSFGDSLIASGGGNIQWLNCDSGIIAGETDTLFVPASTGNYAAIFYDGICTDTSNCIYIETGIPNFNSTSNVIQLYPNPVSKQLFLSYKSSSVKSISIKDVFGRTVLQLTTHHSPLTIDVTNLVSGIYFVELIFDDGNAVKKFLKL